MKKEDKEIIGKALGIVVMIIFITGLVSLQSWGEERHRIISEHNNATLANCNTTDNQHCEGYIDRSCSLPLSHILFPRCS